jgi:hypothetical protein
MEYIKKAIMYSDTLDMAEIMPNLTYIYEGLHEPDSAMIYYKKMYAMDNIYAKQYAALQMGSYYADKGDAKKAKEYFIKSYQYADSAEAQTATESVAKMNALYNYQIKERENLQLKADNANKSMMIVIISFGLLFSIFVSVAIHQYIKNRNDKFKAQAIKRMRIDAERFTQSEKYIQENEKEIKCLKDEIAAQKEQNSELAQQLRQKEQQILKRNSIARLKPEEKELSVKALHSSKIYHKIKNVLNKNVAENRVLSEDDWKLLSKEVNTCFIGFKDRIIDVYNVSVQEYRICLLIKLEISPVDIALLTCRTKGAISESRRRLYFKSFGVKGRPEEWDKFIMML